MLVMNSVHVLLYMWVFSMDDRSFIFLDFRGVFKVLGKTLHTCIYSGYMRYSKPWNSHVLL